MLDIKTQRIDSHFLLDFKSDNGAGKNCGKGNARLALLTLNVWRKLFKLNLN